MLWRRLGNGKAAAFVYAKAREFSAWTIAIAAEETVARIAILAATPWPGKQIADNRSRNDDLLRRPLGHVDILHNNIGGQGTGRTLDTITVEDWNETFTRNVTTTMLTCRAVVPVMEKNGGGAIVNISSIAALRHLSVPTAVYSMTKGAMIEFTKNIALQYAAANVRANCVLPGYIDTPFIQRIVNGRPAYEYKGLEQRRISRCARRHYPVGTDGNWFDIAYASLFLASDESHITGTHLVVDGGVTSHSTRCLSSPSCLRPCCFFRRRPVF